MTLTDSELIIGGLQFVADTLEGINGLIDTQWGLWVLLPPILLLILGSLEAEKTIKNQELLAEKKKNQEILKENKLRKQAVVDAKKAYLNQLLILKAEQATTRTKAQQALLDNSDKNDIQAALVLAEKNLDVDAEIKKTKEELAIAQTELTGAQVEYLQNDIAIMQSSSGILGIWGQFVGVITPVLTIMQGLVILQQALNKAQDKGVQIQKKSLGER